MDFCTHFNTFPIVQWVAIWSFRVHPIDFDRVQAIHDSSDPRRWPLYALKLNTNSMCYHHVQYEIVQQILTN